MSVHPDYRQFLDGRVTLYAGDCLQVMPVLADKSVDCVLADPPYENHMHVGKDETEHPRGRKIRNDGYVEMKMLDFTSIEPIRQNAANEIVRVCSGWALVFCTPEGIAPWRDAFEAAGARYKRACFWVKPDSAPQFNGQGPAMAVEAFVAVWCGRGHSRWNGGGKRNYWTYGTNAPFRDGRHPTEKPVDLISNLIIDFTQADDVILDPFMGSGTTGVACGLTRRQFIGIEALPHWFQVAIERIGGRQYGPDAGAGPLFGGEAA
ncbi:site-specific DNA-methyltransferase [Mesorhizobium sp. BE184]|uniref:DNA-methyltransferase n=1 Tax=Mesorhizobium sp. BE184 TaxID=2817714 RepID=UPI0028575CF1|nr:site-specific DNA-methyltransferase [Mesorhizobium sp. BE184]MDR7035248.1 site-specific DNA-methyltransferase (adenine-specific) [Mesorhizobium sp. BE184]